MKAQSLFDLVENLGVSPIAAFKTHSPATIWNIALLLPQVIKEKLDDKIKGYQGFGYLSDEVNDISNRQNLLNFVRYCDVEKDKTARDFADTCNLFVQLMSYRSFKNLRMFQTQIWV